jgi:Ca2+-binding EF-hand superfamily protein
MIHKLIATGLLASVAAAAYAVQAPPAPPAPAAPPMADREMTRGEVQAMVREHFGKLDKNRDGAIAKDELDFGPMAMRGGSGGPGEHRIVIRRGEGGDHGGNAGHGPGEHGDMMIEHHGEQGRDPAKAFDRLDTNKDGSISREEFAKGREIRIERRIVRGGPEGAGAVNRMQWREHGGKLGGMRGARMIVMSDTDKDGRITLAEAEAMTLQHFDQMDANKDGRVTAEERRAALPIMFRMRKQEHAPKAS